MPERARHDEGARGNCQLPSLVLILPREGEVAPKVTEGEDHATNVTPFLPLRLASASHLPLAGEDASQTRRLCLTAASMKLAKSGCGSKGLDFNSGWN